METGRLSPKYLLFPPLSRINCVEHIWATTMKALDSLIDRFFSIERLRFEEELEQKFLRYYADSFIRHRRLILVLSLVIIGLLGPYDTWVFAESATTIAIIKYGISMPITFVFCFFVFSEKFRDHQQGWVVGCCLFYVFFLTVFLTLGPDQAVRLYNPSYLMVSFFVGSMVRLLFRYAVFVLIATSIAQNILIIWLHPQPAIVIVGYNLFFLGCAAMALASNHYMESSIRKEFLHIENLETSNTELQELASIDSLTCVYNRRYMEDSFEREWLRATRSGTQLGLIMLDVDHFKKYNDFYGHQNGDDCLIQVVQGIRGTFRRGSDIIARYGGEEFAILLPDTSAQDAMQLAEELCKNIEDMQLEHNTSSTSNYVTVSVGVSSLVPQQKEHYSSLIKQADTALYLAKERGRNQAILYQTPPEQ